MISTRGAGDRKVATITCHSITVVAASVVDVAVDAGHWLLVAIAVVVAGTVAGMLPLFAVAALELSPHPTTHMGSPNWAEEWVS
jgi:hypothetical protein